MEYAWVIERDISPAHSPEYYTGCEYPSQYWTADHNAALRFARRQDAETIRSSGLIFQENNQHRVAEHGWPEVGSDAESKQLG